jgi:alanine racemase
LAYIELNSANLKNNINVIKNISNKEILAVIKDNAYGHGLLEIASLLKKFGIKKVCVRDNNEAKKIENFFEEILIFFPNSEKSSEKFSYSVGSIEQLKKIEHKNIHLKFDTGIHRNAFDINDFDEITKLILKNRLNIKGVFSHFCCSDDNEEYTNIQLNRFEIVRQKIESFCKENSLNIPKFHIENSDAIFKLKTDYDYVRPGIALYGGVDYDGLKPVMSLIGERLNEYTLQKNQGIGYNKTFRAEKETKTTLIDLGYSDGILYFRNELKLKNTKAVGKISMDSMSVEGEYEKVVLFDDVREFVKNYDTISYDVLVKLKEDIKRLVV